MTPSQEPQPQPQPQRSSPPRLTLALVGVLVLALGFVGGVGVSRLAGTGDRSATMQPGGGPVPNQSARPAGDATIGTVERVDGDTVYVRTPDGETVKVTTDGDTTVRVSEEREVADLEKGSSVVVRGEKNGDSVTADDIDAGGDRPGGGRVGGPRTESP